MRWNSESLHVCVCVYLYIECDMIFSTYTYRHLSIHMYVFTAALRLCWCIANMPSLNLITKWFMTKQSSNKNNNKIGGNYATATCKRNIIKPFVMQREIKQQCIQISVCLKKKFAKNLFDDHLIKQPLGKFNYRYVA